LKVAEVISIGNELLIGKIVNTNASWLCGKLTHLGFKVRRVTCIGDDLAEISSTINEALNRGAELIVTTGGLGPTFDDMTLQGVAQALNLPLEVNEQALKWVKEKYEQLGLPLTPAREKMAKLPAGAIPIRNEHGAAPGVLLKLKGNRMILCLPGVPREMMQLFESSIPLLTEGLTEKFIFKELSFKLSNIPESSLAPIIDEVLRKNPEVYIKSHPRISEASPIIEIHLSTWVKEALTSQAEQKLLAVKRMLVDLAEKSGGRLLE